MRHEILGEVIQTDGRPAEGVATVRHSSRDIEVAIKGDDQPFEKAVALATDVVRRLPELDQLAKRVAVAELREKYNNGWNEYDEVQEDGSLKPVSNPPLSEADFEAKLSLNAINISGDQWVALFYDDEGMFWGHSVVVNSLNGIDFGEAYAELLG